MHSVWRHLPKNSVKKIEEGFHILLQSFDQRDGIRIALLSFNLAPLIYLAMRKPSEFSIAALMQKVEFSNSQNKFKIDHSFGIHISRTVIPKGGSKRKHAYTEVDQKRFSRSTMSVSVGDNLCSAAALVLETTGIRMVFREQVNATN